MGAAMLKVAVHDSHIKVQINLTDIIKRNTGKQYKKQHTTVSKFFQEPVYHAANKAITCSCIYRTMLLLWSAFFAVFRFPALAPLLKDYLHVALPYLMLHECLCTPVCHVLTSSFLQSWRSLRLWWIVVLKIHAHKTAPSAQLLSMRMIA